MKKVFRNIAWGLIAAFFTTSPGNAQVVKHFLPETPQNMLFFGNSYLGGHGKINLLMNAIDEASDAPEVIATSDVVVGGASVVEQWEAGKAQAEIRTGNYEYVVIQLASAINTPEKKIQFMLHLGLYLDLIDSVGAKPVLWSSWEKRTFPFEQIKAVTDSAALHYDVPLVSVSDVWHMVLAERPLINMYEPDESHPSYWGAYLAACLHYTAYTRKSPVGNTFRMDVTQIGPNDDGIYAMSEEETKYLQGVVWDYMRDFLEPPCTDSSAPAAPGGVAGSGISASEINITWNGVAPAGCDIRKYMVYRGGTYIGSTYEPNFTDQRLLGGTEYSYTIKAVSVANVASVPSAPVAVSTVHDTTPPQFTEASHTRRSNQVVLHFSEMLDTASAEVAANYSIDNGIAVTSAAVHQTGDAVVLTVSELSPDVIYTVTASGIKDNSSSNNVMTGAEVKSFTYIPLSMMDNCVGYWPLDRTLEDYSSRGNNGEWALGESWAAGYQKDAFETSIAPNSTYITIADQAFAAGTGSMSMALWVKKTDAALGGYVTVKNGVFLISMGESNINTYVSTITGAKGKCNLTSDDINDTQWHHIAVTYDGTTVRLYLDGTERQTLAHTGDLPTSTTTIHLGKMIFQEQETFNGIIDEFRLYDSALSPAAVTALYTDDTYAAAAADSAAIVSLFADNQIGLTVASVTQRDLSSGRVLSFLADSIGMYMITDKISQLTHMRNLHCTGSPDADSALVYIDPALGTCTALETLIINDNILAALPEAITQLTNLTLLDVRNNYLCDVSPAVKAWLDTNDPDWADTQNDCPSVVQPGGDGADMYTPARLHLSPNPMTDRVTITVPDGGDGPVEIYTTAGHPVRTLQLNDASDSHRAMHWNGTDTAGNRVAAGVYYVKYGNSFRRIMIVR